MTNNIREYIIDTFKAYWVSNHDLISALPITSISIQPIEVVPPKMCLINLPAWAADIGVEGKILIPQHLIVNDDWRSVDWFYAAFWFLNGLAEQAYEKEKGIIHSYSYKLSAWDARLWQHAWANRIALFLRRWAAALSQTEEDILFGLLPAPCILLTHDVDATTKTWAIRCKQTTFHFFNACRYLKQGNLKYSFSAIKKALYFFVSCHNYWGFEEICLLEKNFKDKSIFNFYASKKRKRLSQKLFDPGYDVQSVPLKKMLEILHTEGHPIGTHLSFHAWQDTAAMQGEKIYLEKSFNRISSYCRQHWLKFSWQKTWKAQENAGFLVDLTLGFNDRPGFRNGAATPFRPWCLSLRQSLSLQAIPTILMDSHLYDYQLLTAEERELMIRRLLTELIEVRGTAAIIWHTHVLNRDYNWRQGYEDLLKIIAELIPGMTMEGEYEH